MADAYSITVANRTRSFIDYHHQKISPTIDLFQTVFFVFKICLLLATVVLNTVVLIIVTRVRNRKHDFSNYLFFSSTIADLLVGLTAEPFMITYNYFYKTSTGKANFFLNFYSGKTVNFVLGINTYEY